MTGLSLVNPQGRVGHWEKHAIFDVADGESPGLVDMTGDGKPELLVHSSDLVKPPEANGMRGGQLGFAEIDWSQPLAKARFHPFTPRSPENDQKYFRYTHGYGAGDVNGDGRMDLLIEGRLVRAAGRRPWRRPDARHRRQRRWAE